MPVAVFILAQVAPYVSQALPIIGGLVSGWIASYFTHKGKRADASAATDQWIRDQFKALSEEALRLRDRQIKALGLQNQRLKNRVEDLIRKTNVVILENTALKERLRLQPGH